MRHVAVVPLGRLQVPVLEPLLQLAGCADLERGEPRTRRGPSGLQVPVDVQHACRLGDAREQLAKDHLIRGAREDLTGETDAARRVYDTRAVAVARSRSRR
jgi:hypothetical protein